MMKAKVKATGEIVNVYFRSPLWYNGDTEETYFPKELDTVWVEERENPSKNIDYWTRLEHQCAGMAMQGMMAHTNIDYDEIVDLCVEFAHALIQKLKEKEERK